MVPLLAFKAEQSILLKLRANELPCSLTTDMSIANEINNNSVLSELIGGRSGLI